MLTGSLVRVRVVKGSLRPQYVKPDDQNLLAVAGALVEWFESAGGLSRDEVEQRAADLVASLPNSLIGRGLVKLLLDRCEFETSAEADPAAWRSSVFAAAARLGWFDSADPARPLTHLARRVRALAVAAETLNQTPSQLEAGLYADLRGAQRLVHFSTLSADRLLDRYNLALAQSVLLRAERLTIRLGARTPARWRQLFRFLKFHQLLYTVTGDPATEGVTLVVDGPLSLFRQTTKYGLAMARFLPGLLLSPDWQMLADVQWGKPARPTQFRLTSSGGLRSHLPDTGQYVPQEIAAFATAFADKVADWRIEPGQEVIPLGREGVCVPDFVFWPATHPGIGHMEVSTPHEPIRMEVLGFWNRSSLTRRLELIRRAGLTRMILAISAELSVDESELDRLPATVYRFRSIPLVRDVVPLLESLSSVAPSAWTHAKDASQPAS